jgi:hypothetical protein
VSHPVDDREENPVERLAAVMQRLPAEVRWLCTAVPALLQAQALDIEPTRGPWQRRGRRLVSMAGRLRLERPLSMLANVILLLRAYAGQFRVKVEAGRRAPLFVGIRALREPDLVRQFAAMQGRPVVRIDERRLANFAAHGRVSLRALLTEMSAVSHEVWRHLDRTGRFGVVSRIDAVNFLTMHGHEYAYLRAWFRLYLRDPGASSLIAFSAISNPSFAAIAAGAQAVYMLHGFQRRSTIYPSLARAVCFTAFEADHVRRRLPECAVTLEKEPVRQIDTDRTLAIAGTYESHSSELIHPVIDWARGNRMPVVVRKHPADETGYWDRWHGIDGVDIRAASGSFTAFLDEVRPRFLACWYSTALFDALLRGIVPITVMPDDGQALDIVFPFRHIALCWPEDAKRAQILLDDVGARNAFVAEKIARFVEGAPPRCDVRRAAGAT